MLPGSEALAGTCGGDLPVTAAPRLGSQCRHRGSQQGGWPRVALLHPLVKEEGAKLCVEPIPEARQELQPLHGPELPPSKRRGFLTLATQQGWLRAAAALPVSSALNPRGLFPRRRNKIPSGCAGRGWGTEWLSQAAVAASSAPAGMPVVATGTSRSLASQEGPAAGPHGKPESGQVLRPAVGRFSLKPNPKKRGLGRAEVPEPLQGGADPASLSTNPNAARVGHTGVGCAARCRAGSSSPDFPSLCSPGVCVMEQRLPRSTAGPRGPSLPALCRAVPPSVPIPRWHLPRQLRCSEDGEGGAR